MKITFANCKFLNFKNKIMAPYSTLSETMNELHKEGYVEDFNLQQNVLNAAMRVQSIC
jgi:hypothetical protein